MKILALAVAALFLGGNIARGVERPIFVNATFQDILSRVARRDRESQAILEVQLKEEPTKGGVDFSIEPAPEDKDRIAVKLFTRWMTGDTVFESYLLKPDAAIRQELENQRRMIENAKQREIERFAQLKRSIIELSDGTLSYGMSFDEVVKIKGEPQKLLPISFPVVQQAQINSPQFAAIYDDMEITFTGELRDGVARYARLVGVKLISGS